MCIRAIKSGPLIPGFAEEWVKVRGIRAALQKSHDDKLLEPRSLGETVARFDQRHLELQAHTCPRRSRNNRVPHRAALLVSSASVRRSEFCKEGAMLLSSATFGSTNDSFENVPFGFGLKLLIAADWNG